MGVYNFPTRFFFLLIKFRLRERLALIKGQCMLSDLSNTYKNIYRLSTKREKSDNQTQTIVMYKRKVDQAGQV